MATNKNALIRYRTIDKCLQNRSRMWTLNDLIHACSDALYEYEGKDTNVSKRTVQLDIQVMRSNKLGYNAPIIVQKKKYYTYAEEGYSISDVPLTQIDMDILTESVQMLSQFKDISLFRELNGVIQKLEDKIYRASNHQADIIHMEKNEDLRGLHHLDTLYQGILKKIVFKLMYQSFNSSKAHEFLFHGYILKEYNNRWFIVGRKDRSAHIVTLALDRIVQVDYDLTIEYRQHDFNADTYYRHTYGVTVLNEDSIIDIHLLIDKSSAPYVITKPFHRSQQVIKSYTDGRVLLSLQVHHNYEIERLILGFGESIEVIKPLRLRNRIIKKLMLAIDQYH